MYVGDERLTKYAIGEGEYLIGRDRTCQIIIEIEGVSRHHARLTFQGYELLIEDLGSANGIFLEGVQIALPTRVRPDQQIEIGSARLFVHLHADTSEMLAASLWNPDLGLAPVRAMLEGKKYRVLASIGRGGMGVVHQARDLRIRRNVAMKVIRVASQFSRENVLRFVEEAQLTGQLQHPNIIPVYEIGVDEHREVFYTMKFVRGITLDQVIRELRQGRAETIQKYPLSALLNIFQKICDGVAYAHSMGVVHRDLKPDNIMLGEYGEVLVMDWGLAKKIAHGVSEEHLTDHTPEIAPDLRGFQTVNGLIVGTPPYIAPEAARGELEMIDARSDIYVLGTILYAMLTLRAPYPGREFAEIIEQIVTGKFIHPINYNAPSRTTRPPTLERPSESDDLDPPLSHLPGRRIPEGLAAVVLKAMAYQHADRYQTVAEMQADIIAWQTGFAPKAERAGLRRQLILWAARHKTNVFVFAVFAILFPVAVVWGFYSITRERNLTADSARIANLRTQQLSESIAELRGTAPLLEAEAREGMRRKDFEAALDRIESAIQQVPNDPAYHELRGDILQTLLRWDDAADAYESALSKNPRLEAVRGKLELTRRLLAGQGEDPEPGAAQLRELQAAMIKQGREIEADAIADTLRVEQAIAGMASRLTLDDPKIAPLRPFMLRREFRGRFRRLDDGTYAVNGAGLSVANVREFLQVRPPMVSALVLDGVNLADLAVLAGLELKQLSLKGCREISDLAPLAGMKLQRLNLDGTAVQNLAPVAGMPLVELSLAGCERLTDLSPLRSSTTLERLLLPPQVDNVASLRDLSSLRFLSYRLLSQPAADFWKEYDDAHPK